MAYSHYIQFTNRYEKSNYLDGKKDVLGMYVDEIQDKFLAG